MKSEFRSMPEGEEKSCTTCGDWWPCDVEFFKAKTKRGRNKIWVYWSASCRACISEQESRARSARRAA